MGSTQILNMIFTEIQRGDPDWRAVFFFMKTGRWMPGEYAGHATLFTQALNNWSIMPRSKSTRKLCNPQML